MIHTVLTKCQTNHIYLKSLYSIEMDAIIQMRPFSGLTKTFQFTMQSFSLLQFVQKLWLLHNLFWHDFNLYISFNYFSTSGWQFGPVWFWIFWKFKWLACRMMNNLSVRQINWLWWWCNWFGKVRVNLHANSVGRFRLDIATMFNEHRSAMKTLPKHRFRIPSFNPMNTFNVICSQIDN